MTLTDPATAVASASYMLAVSLLVLGLMYWRRGIDRWGAIACLLLYLPSFVIL